MGKKLVIFFGSVLILFGLIIVALFASMVFSIKQAAAPMAITGSNNIAVLEIEGVIMTSFKVTEQIAKILDEPNVRAVVVRIDSPGGAVGPAQEIYSEILKLRKSVPVYASLGSIAASGGYYIASACEKIYSNPGTLTGSIGVIMNFVNLKNVYKFLKMDHSVIKSGKFKDIGSGLREMLPNEKTVLQAIIDDTFKQFLAAILATRKLSKAAIDKISDGRILTGLQAKDLGLIDEIGTLNDAIESISKKAKIDSKPKVIYPLRQKEKLIDYLLDKSVSNIVTAVKKQIHPTALFFLPENILEVLYENN